MLTRMNLIRQGYCLSQVISISCRAMHVTDRLLANNESSSKKNRFTSLTRSNLSASQISKAVLDRFQFHERRDLVKTLVIGSGITIVLTITFLYVFRKPIKNQTVAQVADVAKSSLEQENVKQQVHLLSQELIQNLLSDPDILSRFLVFLERIIDDASTKQTLIRLLQRLMMDAEMQKYVSEFVSRIVYDIMQRPETEIQLAQLFRRAILQKDNQDALYMLLKEFVHDIRTKLLVTNLALETCHQVLNDEKIQQATTKFLQDILNDTTVQEKSGDFAWLTFKNALKPKWFSK